MKVDINQDMLTEEQAQWLKEIFVSFSDNLISSNIFTPSLLNQNLRNLNNNAQIPTYDNLTKALNNAVESGELTEEEARYIYREEYADFCRQVNDMYCGR